MSKIDFTKTEKFDYSKIEGHDALGNIVLAGDFVATPMPIYLTMEFREVLRVLPNWRGKYGQGGGLLLGSTATSKKTVRVYEQVVKLLPQQFMPYLFNR